MLIIVAAIGAGYLAGTAATLVTFFLADAARFQAKPGDLSEAQVSSLR